jgi:hypothetical protein
MEKSRGEDDHVDQMSQALNRPRAMVGLPKYSPPMPRPPTGDGRPRGGWREGGGSGGLFTDANDARRTQHQSSDPGCPPLLTLT